MSKCEGAIILFALLSVDVCSHVWGRQWWKSERWNLLQSWKWTEDRGTWLLWEQWRETTRDCACDSEKTWTQAPKPACCHRKACRWNHQGKFLCLFRKMGLHISWLWVQENSEHKPHSFLKIHIAVLWNEKAAPKSQVTVSLCSFPHHNACISLLVFFITGLRSSCSSDRVGLLGKLGEISSVNCVCYRSYCR